MKTHYFNSVYPLWNPLSNIPISMLASAKKKSTKPFVIFVPEAINCNAAENICNRQTHTRDTTGA